LRSSDRFFIPLIQSTLRLAIVLLLLGGLHNDSDSCCGVLGYYSVLYSLMRILTFKRDIHLLLHVLVLTVEAACFHKMVVLT
jgi:hypothetical protein